MLQNTPNLKLNLLRIKKIKLGELVEVHWGSSLYFFGLVNGIVKRFLKWGLNAEFFNI